MIKNTPQRTFTSKNSYKKLDKVNLKIDRGKARKARWIK